MTSSAASLGCSSVSTLETKRKLEVARLRSRGEASTAGTVAAAMEGSSHGHGRFLQEIFRNRNSEKDWEGI